MSTRSHTHQATGELCVFWVPADTDQPMELKVVKDDWRSLGDLVGGYIEIVRSRVMPDLKCGCSLSMVVNEEGLLKGLPSNPRATTYYPFPGTEGIVGDAFLVGEGLVVKSGEVDRDLFSLPEEFRYWEGPGSPIPEPRERD